MIPYLDEDRLITGRVTFPEQYSLLRFEFCNTHIYHMIIPTLHKKMIRSIMNGLNAKYNECEDKVINYPYKILDVTPIAFEPFQGDLPQNIKNTIGNICRNTGYRVEVRW